MDCGLSITIKDYHNGGGDLTLKLISAQYTEKALPASPVKLTVTRKPDQYSSRLGTFAFLRNTQPGYQSLGFSQVTLNWMRCNEAGAFVSLTTNIFFDVAVESNKPQGSEEIITFVARKKTAEKQIP
jgi:hypothetical protein